MTNYSLTTHALPIIITVHMVQDIYNYTLSTVILGCSTVPANRTCSCLLSLTYMHIFTSKDPVTVGQTFILSSNVPPPGMQPHEGETLTLRLSGTLVTCKIYT